MRLRKLSFPCPPAPRNRLGLRPLRPPAQPAKPVPFPLTTPLCRRSRPASGPAPEPPDAQGDARGSPRLMAMFASWSQRTATTLPPSASVSASTRRSSIESGGVSPVGRNPVRSTFTVTAPRPFHRWFSSVTAESTTARKRRSSPSSAGPAGGPEVDFHPRLRGDGVHRGPAADAPDVERGLRARPAPGTLRCRRSRGPCAWIGFAMPKLPQAVAARPREGDPIAAAADALRHDAETVAVERDEPADCRPGGPRRDAGRRGDRPGLPRPRSRRTCTGHPVGHGRAPASAATTARSTARPRQSSPIPGRRATLPSRRDCTSVPFGKHGVQVGAEHDARPRRRPGRSPRTFPTCVDPNAGEPACWNSLAQPRPRALRRTAARALRKRQSASRCVAASISPNRRTRCAPRTCRASSATTPARGRVGRRGDPRSRRRREPSSEPVVMTVRPTRWHPKPLASEIQQSDACDVTTTCDAAIEG